MKFAFLMAALAATFSVSAVEIARDWQIVVPDAAKDERQVPQYLREAAERLREALAEGAGLQIPVREASAAKPGVHALYLGGVFAEKAGLLPADMTGYANAYAEKGGDVYLFGRDLNGHPKSKRVYWQQCVLPSVRAMVRFMEDVLDVRFLLSGRTGTDIPKIAKVEVKDGVLSRENTTPARYRAAVGKYAGNLELSAIDYFAAAYPVREMMTAAELLARAEKEKGLSDKVRRRLALVRVEFGYLDNLVTMGHLYSAYRICPTRPLFEELANTVEARRALIDALYPKGADPKPLPIEGWPEMEYFGGCQKHWAVDNGRWGGLVTAPAKWDIALLRQTGVLPGAAMKRITVGRTSTVPSATDFEDGVWAKAKWNDLGGMQLQRIPKAARFKVLAGETAIYFAVESDLADAKPVPHNGHDGPICGTESADLFLDPTGSREVCYHLNWNCYDDAYLDEAFGLIKDPLDPMWGKFVSLWNPEGVTYRNTRGGNRWKTLVTVPYAAIDTERPAPNAKWCLNVAREWGADEHSSAAIVDALWSPNLELGGFCSLDALGEMVFE